MKVHKLKVAIYSICQRLQGRQLLKNPKGTPATTVRTISHFSFINSKNLDIINCYTEYTKDFAKPSSPITTKYLNRIDWAFFNKEKKEFRRQKQIDFFQITNPYSAGICKEGIKGVVQKEELQKRDTDSLKEKVAKIKEEYVDFSMAFLGYAAIKEAIFEKSRAEIAIEQYKKKRHKMAQKEFKKAGFWATLSSNLKQ